MNLGTDWRSRITNKIQDDAVSWLFGAGTVVITSAFLSVQGSLAPYFADSSGKLALWAFAAAVLFLILAVYIHIKNKPKYKHLPAIGVHQHLKSGAYFCSHCLITQKQHSPLHISPNRKGWSCSACDKFIKNPDYIEPQVVGHSTIPQGPQSWMA